MISPENALRQIPARSVDTILGVLKTLRKRANAGEAIAIPCLHLRLRSGHQITGRLLDVTENKGEMVVLLHESDCNDRSPATHAAYFSAHDIEVLTILDAGSLAHLISFGAVVFPPGTQAPTMLALRRRAEEIATEIGTSITLTLTPEEDSQRFRLGQYLEALGTVLRGFTADDIGQQAVMNTAFVLQSGTLNATKTDDGVVITVDLNTTPDSPTLSDVISSVL